jgi:prevent-host-death family protein
VKTVSALDVRRRFGQLLDEAAAGERIVIERAGMPLAALVPLSDLAEADPRAAAARELAALAEIRRLVAEAPAAPERWDSAAAVRADRDSHRDRDPAGEPARGPAGEPARGPAGDASSEP